MSPVHVSKSPLIFLDALFNFFFGGSVWALCVVAKKIVKKLKETRVGYIYVYGSRRDFIDCELEVHFEVFKQDNFHWEQ